MADAPAITDFTLPERCGASAAHDLASAGRALDPGARMRIDAGAVARMSCATELFHAAAYRCNSPKL